MTTVTIGQTSGCLILLHYDQTFGKESLSILPLNDRIMLNHNPMECKEGRQFDPGVPKLVEGSII